MLKKIHKFSFSSLLDWLRHKQDLFWLVFLTFFILLNIIVLFVNLNLYSKIEKEQVFIVEGQEQEDSSIIILDKDKMKEIVNFFKERERKFKEDKESPPSYGVDPSV